MVKFFLLKRIAVTLAGCALCLVASTGCRSGPRLFVVPQSGEYPTVVSTPASTQPGPDLPPAPKRVSSTPWVGLTAEPILLAALKLAYDHVPAIRPLVDHAASSAVHIVIAQPEDPDALGVFDSGSRLIALAPPLLNEPASVIAAVLMHEIEHANQPYEPGADACYAREAAAYAREAETYEALRTGREDTPLARFQDQLVQAWRAGQLEALVHSWPLYKRQCLAPR